MARFVMSRSAFNGFEIDIQGSVDRVCNNLVVTVFRSAELGFFEAADVVESAASSTGGGSVDVVIHFRKAFI